MIKVVYNVWLFFFIFDVSTFTYIDKTSRIFLEEFCKERRISSFYIAKRTDFFGSIIPHIVIFLISAIPILNLILGIYYFFCANSIMAKTCCKVCNTLFINDLITEADMEYLSKKMSREFNVEIEFHKPETSEKTIKETSKEDNSNERS